MKVFLNIEYEGIFEYWISKRRWHESTIHNNTFITEASVASLCFYLWTGEFLDRSMKMKAPPNVFKRSQHAPLHQRSRICCGNQYKRYVGLRVSTSNVKRYYVKTNRNGMSREHWPCRCVRHFGLRWAVKIEINGIAQDALQKLVQILCRSSILFVVCWKN